MARLHVVERTQAQAVMDELHDALGRRLAARSLAPCPVEFTAALVGMCSTQSCGKCTPCRVGLRVLADQLEDILAGRAQSDALEVLERTARTIYLSSDCAIGYEAGSMALAAVRGFRDDFEHHIKTGSCGFEERAESVPCVAGCPAGVDVPGYVSLVEAGRCTDAVRLIRKDNPLPIVCGLVCEHPCEMHCRRGIVDDAVNILALKRYATDHMDKDYKPHIASATGKTVAVIGGGPAGISAAYYLTLMGHKVTIFEERAHLGGMLRYGIPAYRLPRERLQEELDWICACGIDTRMGERIDGARLQELRNDYDAVYLAIGAHGDKKLGLPGEDARGVLSAVELLRAIGDDKLPDLSGQRVVVIGGGNVAMDVARSAVRLGAQSVTIVYRRRVCDMTAQDAEIAGAQQEGCELLELTSPCEIVTNEDNSVCGLVVQPQIIGAPRSGRPAPRAADTAPYTIACETIVVAIGQQIDYASFEAVGIPCNNGMICADEDGSVEGIEGLYSGGDCQSGPATVIRAINAGKVAAGNIDHYLGFDHKVSVDVDLPPVQFKGKRLCGRCEMTEREAALRTGDFEQVERGLTEQEARQEASRCLRCDHFGFGAFRGGRTLQW